MRRGDAEDFSQARPVEAPAGPLFAAAEPDSPFARSKVPPSSQEVAVASLIWVRQGRTRPIPLAEIGTALKISEREVKAVVAELRITHRMPIGALRDWPGGYFWMVDARDFEVGLQPYRQQVVSGWRLLRALDEPARLRELHGQLRMED